jgi:predicted metal-dependent peptidase
MIAGSPVELKLLRARVQLLFKQPFFATLCLRLKLIPGSFVPTMATNGKVICYNTDFVESLTPEEVEGVLAHEVSHCALGHHCRRGNRKKRLWNVACDYAINPILLKNGLVLPAGALVNADYENLSAEQIYDRLSQEQSDRAGAGKSQSPGAGTGSGAGNGAAPDVAPQTGPASSGNIQQPSSSCNDGTHDANQPPPEEDDDLNTPREGGFGEVLDATDDDGNPAGEGQANRQASDWAVAAQQALQAAKGQGHGTSDFERRLRESRESTQDWRGILRAFVAATALSDYRWSPPNRRFVAAGIYLPSLHREGTGPLVIGVDTSGSISERELDQFAGEISAISDQAQPERIHVVYCDEAVTGVQEFGPSEPIELEPKGGEGTDFRPVFQWAEDNGIEPACLIYLTDLDCTRYPDVPPSYPVLWVTSSRRSAPFGETVRIIADA